MKAMNLDEESERSLKELEEEALSEGREWIRQRLEQKLQQRAERIEARFSPRGPALGAPPTASADAAHGGGRRSA